ncbi:MAG: DUF2489 domain-containing protein [Myxococcales bacterium]|nr:DUF2489 domain-containing protein [Myxococcales bacterium]MCB9718433.1 DUF2489 domain-containing protein [Myxococcales bacterium]
MAEVPPTIRMQLCIEDVLRNRVPLFDGVERLLGISEQVPELARDRDLRKLAELLAQVEHLPIGAARAHWQREALHRVDRELMELERRHQDAVFYACRRLQDALGRLLA